MEVDEKIVQIHEKIDKITPKIKVLDMEISEIEKELKPARAQKNMPVWNRLSEQWINLMTESTLLSKERNGFIKELSDAWTLKIESEEQKIREQKNKEQFR
jgi:archaellum component FlaC